MNPPPLKRILLVEDDPDIQAVGQLALEVVGGFEIAVCSSGQEALTVAPVFDPELILLDVMMPGLDGPATLRQLRVVAATEHTPVIFLTARSQQHEVNHYIGLGAIDVIAKPFDPMALANLITQIWTAHHG